MVRINLDSSPWHTGSDTIPLRVVVCTCIRARPSSMAENTTTVSEPVKGIIVEMPETNSTLVGGAEMPKATPAPAPPTDSLCTRWLHRTFCRRTKNGCDAIHALPAGCSLEKCGRYTLLMPLMWLADLLAMIIYPIVTVMQCIFNFCMTLVCDVGYCARCKCKQPPSEGWCPNPCAKAMNQDLSGPLI